MIDKKAWWQRATNKIAATRLGAWYILNIAHHLDRWLVKWSNGRFNHSILAGQPNLILISIGAKSGKTRTTPLIYYPDGENIILIASNGGSTHNPSWYYNLKANPEVSVIIGGQDNDQEMYVSREVFDEERERYWQLAQSQYAGFNKYEERANGRYIPVIHLTPRETG